MKHILIVDASDTFRSVLTYQLCKEYRVTACADGETALRLLTEHHPDILVLELGLPGKDGLDVLRDAGFFAPRIILATTLFYNPYVQQAAKDLGVGYIMRKPCRTDAIAARIADMVRRAALPQPPDRDPQSIVADHLLRLGFAPGLDGYQQLRIGIPLFAQDPAQRLGKELYPAIAELFGIRDGQAVERSIRAAITKAWETGNRDIWAEYFHLDSGSKKECPVNKDFIARMAKILEEE